MPTLRVRRKPPAFRVVDVVGTERLSPRMVRVTVAGPDLEVADAGGRLDELAAEWHLLPDGARPGDALVAAVRAVDLVPGMRVWVAGETAAVQRVRRYLFEERGLPRSAATVRGCWKRGCAGDPDGD